MKNGLREGQPLDGLVTKAEVFFCLGQQASKAHDAFRLELVQFSLVAPLRVHPRQKAQGFPQLFWPHLEGGSQLVEDAEGRFEGFVHVDNWVQQKLVTATGPNPLPR